MEKASKNMDDFRKQEAEKLAKYFEAKEEVTRQKTDEKISKYLARFKFDIPEIVRSHPKSRGPGEVIRIYRPPHRPLPKFEVVVEEC